MKNILMTNLLIITKVRVVTKPYGLGGYSNFKQSSSHCHTHSVYFSHVCHACVCWIAKPFCN